MHTCMCCDLHVVARTRRIKKCGVSPAAATFLELLYKTSTSNNYTRNIRESAPKPRWKIRVFPPYSREVMGSKILILNVSSCIYIRSSGEPGTGGQIWRKPTQMYCNIPEIRVRFRHCFDTIYNFSPPFPPLQVVFALKVLHNVISVAHTTFYAHLMRLQIISLTIITENINCYVPHSLYFLPPFPKFKYISFFHKHLIHVLVLNLYYPEFL